MTTDTPLSSDRNFSIDTFRLISIFFVILHHIEAFKRTFELHYGNPVAKFLYYFPENVRFLPFFFIAAGYFFSKGVAKGEPLNNRLWRYCKRLARLFFLWSLIYAFFMIPKEIALQGQGYLAQTLHAFTFNVSRAIAHPFAFLTRGTIENFWFFPALIIGLVIVVALHKWGKEKYIIPLGVALYLIALLGKAYSVLPFGYQVEFEMRQGPFVSTLFVGIGWLLAKKTGFQLKTAVLLICAGIAMHILEVYFLFSQYGLKPKHDYLLGTVLFCTGIFIFTLAMPNIGKGTIFPQWGGQLTLGIYAVHTLFIKVFGIFRPNFNAVTYEILQPIVIFLLSVFFTLLLKRNSVTKILVT